MGYKIWNKTDDLITPTLEVFTPQQIFAQYPASQHLDMIISDSATNMAVFMECTQTKSIYSKLIADRHADLEAKGITCTCAHITDDITK